MVYLKCQAFFDAMTGINKRILSNEQLKILIMSPSSLTPKQRAKQRYYIKSVVRNFIKDMEDIRNGNDEKTKRWLNEELAKLGLNTPETKKEEKEEDADKEIDIDDVGGGYW